jgi:tetraacyldisaccharide 4'-kinase
MISAIYSTLMRMRNACFDAGILRSRRLPVPTISVGNITVGGTGKTPMVTKIAEMLIAAGEKPCILTRGYGRADVTRRVVVSDGENILAEADEGGDEPFEMAKRLGGKVVVIADRNRMAAGEWAVREFGVTVAILDDGFQHRRVARDLDIVCVDATDPFGNGRTLPSGKLRESLSSLKRADLLVLTRSNLVSQTELERLEEKVRHHSEKTEMLRSSNHTADIVEIGGFLGGDGDSSDFGDFRNKNAFLFCALGNPQSFLTQMKEEGLKIVGKRFLRDHSGYDQKIVTEIEGKASAGGAAFLITTPKDAVKLREVSISLPCFVVETVPRLVDEAKFEEIIRTVIESNHH